MTTAQLSEAEPIVKSIARRFEGGGLRCGLAVEDLEQEAWVSLCKAEKKFRGESGWSTFVWAVCFRCCRDLTASYREKREDELDGQDFALPENDTGLAPENLSAIQRAVELLPKRQRAIVALHFGLNKPPPLKLGAVARRLKIHRNTAAPELRAALATLGQKLSASLLTQ